MEEFASQFKNPKPSCRNLPINPRTKWNQINLKNNGRKLKNNEIRIWFKRRTN